MLRFRRPEKPKLVLRAKRSAQERECAEREVIAALAQLLLEDVSRRKPKHRLRLVRR